GGGALLGEIAAVRRQRVIRNRKMKRRAFAEVGFGPDPPAMTGDNALAGRQAKSDAVGSGHPLISWTVGVLRKGLENPLAMVAVDPNSIVAKREPPLVVVMNRLDVNRRRRVAVVFDAVLNEVLEQLRQEHPVGAQHRERLGNDLNA